MSSGVPTANTRSTLCGLMNNLTQLLFVSGSVVVVVATSIFKFTYGISARAEAGSSDVKAHGQGIGS